MNRVYNIDKEQIINFLKEGKSTRDIEKIINIPHGTISHFIRGNNLQCFYDKPKLDPWTLNKIDNKWTAYMIGFIIAGGSISKERVTVTVALRDKSVCEAVANILGTKCHVDNTLDRKKRRFPNVRMCRKIRGINKFIGGDKKVDRNVPIVSKHLESYLMRGLFDADGYITWGRRKDRNRVWQKISFTSSQSILESVQKILYKMGISSCIKPKKGEGCFVLEFSNKADVLKFCEYLYKDLDFIPCPRKFINYQALRRELGEISEEVYNDLMLSVASDLSEERAETSGELNGTLNDHTSTQGSDESNNTVKI